MAPQIPDFTAVGTASPSGRMAIPRRNGRAPVAEALGDLGNVVGQVAEKENKRVADLAYTTAKSEYIRGQIDIQTQAVNSPDYKTWQSGFDKNALKLRTDIGAKLTDPDARAKFEMDTNIDAARISAEIARDASVRHRETQTIAIEQQTEDDIGALVSAKDEVTRTALLQNRKDAIDAAVREGLYSGEQGAAKLKHVVESYAKGRANTMTPRARLGELRTGMRTDEKGQITFAKSGTSFDFIRDDERLQMIAQAETDLAQQEAVAERGRKQRGDEFLKEAWSRHDAGSLDRAYIEQARPYLAPSEYKTLLDSLKGGEADKDSPDAVIDLERTLDQDSPQEFQSKATRYLRTGRITTGTYRTLIGQNRQAYSEGQPDTPYKTGRAFIRDSLDPGQLVSGAARVPFARAQNRALQDFDRWAQGRTFSREEGTLEAERLVSRYETLAAGEMRPSLPKPYGYTGQKNAVTPQAIANARAAVIADLDAGKIEQVDASRELEYLEDWERTMSPAVTAPPAKAR